MKAENHRILPASEIIPPESRELVVEADGRQVKLTNLHKPYFPDEGLTKGDLLRYYAAVSPVLLGHLRDRAMVMKRYPDGAQGDFFFMKRAPAHRPQWLETCAIAHSAGSKIHYPVVGDLATLLWIVNLGCIDLNPWYARCDDTDRPDYLHFDLDPVESAGPVAFDRVLEAACAVHDALDALGAPSYAKTSGSRGVHIYVPIERGPTQKQVWDFSKALAQLLARQHPELLTAEYRIGRRPPGHVLVDYNQNAWGRTLASVYSVRPRPGATVSAPVTWRELRRGVRMEDFRMDNMPRRIARVGDLWQPLTPDAAGRTDLARLAA